jgi:hypothetical protein
MMTANEIVQVLFICGDQSPIYNSESELEEIKTIFPNSTFVEVGGLQVLPCGRCIDGSAV